VVERRRVTPDEQIEYWRAEAARNRTEAQRVREMAELQARALEELATLQETNAAAMAALRAEESTGNNVQVTKAQKARRGESVARTRAKHPVAVAIVGSDWKTTTAYARRRLRVSQPAFSRYLTGGLECPPEVADKVREDFGLGDDVWIRPPRR
jgi:hypothetical protein